MLSCIVSPLSLPCASLSLLISCTSTGAANRHPDSCEQNPEQARIINVEGTKALARATSSRGIFLIYISTDYVFPGRPGEAPYEADGKPEPPNTYGLFKLDGEKATLEATKDDRLGVVLRIPVLYGSAKENKESAVNVLVDAVWKAQEKGAKVQMDDWSIRYPTNTEDVGRVCQDIAANYLEAGRDERSKLPTVLQFSSEDRYTKYKMSQILAEILGLPLDGMVANEQGNDPSVAVQRPYDTHLSTKKLKELGIPIWTQDFKAWL